MSDNYSKSCCGKTGKLLFFKRAFRKIVQNDKIYRSLLNQEIRGIIFSRTLMRKLDSWEFSQFNRNFNYMTEVVYQACHPKKKFLYDTGKMDASRISPEWLGYFLPVLYRNKIICMAPVKRKKK